MKSKFKTKKLRATSVDSKLTKEGQFIRLLDLEPIENITEINRPKYTYQIELNYPTSLTRAYAHYQITYSVIARQAGSSTVIKLKNIVRTSSKLRKLVKVNKAQKRMQIKWIPRIKTRQ